MVYNLSYRSVARALSSVSWRLVPRTGLSCAKKRPDFWFLGDQGADERIGFVCCGQMSGRSWLIPATNLCGRRVAKSGKHPSVLTCVFAEDGGPQVGASRGSLSGRPTVAATLAAQRQAVGRVRGSSARADVPPDWCASAARQSNDPLPTLTIGGTDVGSRSRR